ncbi:MAG TPA: ABC transporter ATP-binding protein, partial [Rhizobium sp.]
RKNLDYPLRKRGIPAADRSKRIKEIAATMHMEQLLERRPNQLSGGQQQRVALGRAMIRDPSVFLLDEPLSNLDAQLRGVMRTELSRVHKVTGQTMIYVTHDQLEAMTMSDRIAVFNHGRLQQVGSPSEIYKMPANTFVARFVGTPQMNLFKSQISTGSRGYGLRAGSIFIPLTFTVAGDSVEAGLRPEHVRIVEGDTNAEVVAIEMTGPEAYAHLRTDVGIIIARRDSADGLRVGDRVRVSADGADLHFFDAAEGTRIL